MPTSFDVADLNIPQDSEVHSILKEFPDIEKLCFHDGDYIIREDEADADTFVVVMGSYVVEQSGVGPGKEPRGTLAIVISDVDSPSFVGEMAYLGGGFRTASVRSSGSTYALRLKPRHMDVIIAKYPFFTSILCRQFTARLGDTNKILKNMTMESELIMKEAGEVVLRKGEKADRLYQLVDGSLAREGEEEIIRSEDTYSGFIDPGPYFLDGEYESTLKTITPSSLVAISKDSKLAVIRNFPELVLRLYQEISA